MEKTELDRITDKQLKQFSRLIYNEAGINLHEGKKQLLEARLAKRLRQIGDISVDAYLNLIEKNHSEFIQFLDAVSTNHTYFFREDHHFNILNKTHSQIWCAASSSGEEPYSIAIYCLENGFSPKIFATDISTHMIRIGISGVYPKERAQKIKHEHLKQYFQKGQGEKEGLIRIKPEIRRMVTFQRFNLLSDPLPNQLFDVIFLRNVLIYFDTTVKTQVIQRLNSCLKKNGYFIVGGAESLSGLNHPFKYLSPSIYQKS